MDPLYIIKIKIIFTLNINTPIATWILARLFDDEKPITRKNLLKNLCQASFSSMGDNDFDITIKQLESEKYIEFTRSSISENIHVNSMGTLGLGGTKIQPVTKEYEGYVISEKGIIEFRKQIATKIEKIRPLLHRLELNKIARFQKIIDTITSTASLTDSVVKLCIDNAPLVLDFIRTIPTELANIGIQLS
jgi:hypothetical protein